MNNEFEADTTLSHYRIISKIGKGGMGDVYLAQDTKLERQVALKILPGEFAEDSERMGRFVREAKSASALNHPNIITIHEIGESEGTHFIATEYIEGKTLNEYATENPLNHKSALDIAIQIVSALDEAHQAGIVHRDIKPDNVMIRTNGLVKILDFGIAKVVEERRGDTETRRAGEDDRTLIAASPSPSVPVSQSTIPGMIIGTPNYMSPEQTRGKDVDLQTDIFSFGVVFYEMLSGSSPFAGDSVSDVIAAVLTKEPKSLTGIPPVLKEIVDKTLQKDKKNRYQTAKDLLDDLEEARQELEMNSRLERTSSPNLQEPKTQILRVPTDEESPAKITNSKANSIAVLPFTNMSADEDNEYFCDGLAEELLNALSKIEDLKVAARTSAFSFKGKNTNVSNIGKTLGVRNVLEGSVRKSGDKLRISVRLENAADGYQIWSESYDREMKDIFEVQDEIALAVVEALKLKLLGGEKESVTKRFTNNAEAYQLYLRGRYHFARRTIDDMRKAIDYFQQALKIDSEYVLAYVGMADVYNSWTKSLLFSPKESVPQAKSAAIRSLEIDPALAEGHASLADSLAIFDWNWAEAESEFKRAIQLNPNVSHIHFTYGISYLVPMGRMEEAIAALKKAVELEPLSLILNSILAEVYLFARQKEKALDQAKIAFDLNPNFGTARFWLGHALLANGLNEEAIELCESGLQNSPSNLVFLYIAGQSYARSGMRQKAEQIIEQIREESKTKYVQAYSVARIYTELGDKDKAFAELEKAFEQRDWWLPRLKTDPLMDSLRNDPRFNKLLQKIGLPLTEAKSTDDKLEANTVMLRPTTAETAGVAPTSELTINPRNEARNSKPKWWLFGLFGLIIFIGGFFGFGYFSTGNQIESIAVMPFVNESGNEDIEYLSDGMTETLISSLSKLANLNVKPRSAVFRYKGKNTDPQMIAKELDVQAILNGRIVQRGDQLTLSLELVDVQKNSVIWADSYNRKQSDLVTLQSEIARDVSTKLKSKLSGADEAKVTKTATVDPEAYQAYLKGRYYWNRRTGENIKKAIEQFKSAVDRDPNYALAFAGLADCYALLPEYAGNPVSETAPQAIAYAKRAIAIDSQLGEPHATLGIVSHQLWKWEESEKEYKRSIEINPNYATAYHWYSILLKNLGRYDEAARMIRRAAELDPLSGAIGCNISMIYQLENNHEASVRNALKMIELDPTFGRAYEYLGTSYLKLGRNEEAVETMEKAVELTNRQNVVLSELGYVYGATGKRAEALAVAKELEEKYTLNEAAGHEVAGVYSGLGDIDKAFEWLEKDFQKRDGRLTTLRWELQFEPLRDDPRFKDLLKRMGLPE